MKARLKLHCNENSFNFYAALFFTFIINALFLRRAWGTLSYTRIHDYLFAATLPVVLFSGFLFLFSVAAVPWFRKPLLIILLFFSAAANYAIYSFGTVIDTDTVQNILENGLQQTTDQLSVRYLLWLVVAGLIPAAFIALLTIRTIRPWWMNIAYRAVVALSSAVMVLLVAALFYRDYAVLLRNDKSLVQMITPANVVSSVEEYADDRWFAGDHPLPAMMKIPTNEP